MDEQTTTTHATDSVRLITLLPVSPERLYAAWLDSREHSRMTGGEATIDPVIGGRHAAWNGYVTGVTLELEHGRRIVQTWRAEKFPADALDSRLELLFEPEGDGTRLTVIHTEIPAGMGAGYERGWEEQYFAPMRKYFAPRTAAPSRAKPAKKKTSTRHAKAKATARRVLTRRRKKSKTRRAAKPRAKAKAKTSAKRRPSSTAQRRMTSKRRSRRSG
jgi:uncharacterized protein YndB with AHSA1/START domain